MVGDQKVGKSSFISKFCYGNFDEGVRKSMIIHAYYKEEVLDNGFECRFELMDCMGMEGTDQAMKLTYQ